MAPEMFPNRDGMMQPYLGPPVDVFASGVVLFIMSFAKFPFGSAGDDCYECLHKDPLAFL